MMGKVDDVCRDVDRYKLTMTGRSLVNSLTRRFPIWVSAGDVTWASAP